MEPVVVSVTVDTAALEARLGALAERALAEALAGGLAEAGACLVGRIVANAEADGIRSRTGHLLGSVGLWSEPGAVDALEVFVGVPADSPAARYAYLLTDEDVHVLPRGHEYLAIPTGENLTAAGVARYDSPRQLDDLVFRGLTAGVMVGEEYRPYFALATDVWIFGRGSMERAADEGRAEMVALVQERVDALLEESA